MSTHTLQQTQSLARMISEGLTEFNEFRRRIRSIYIVGAILFLAGVVWFLYVIWYVGSHYRMILAAFALLMLVEALWYILCWRICSKRYKKRFIHYFTTMNMGILTYTTKHYMEKGSLVGMSIFGTLERYRKMLEAWTTTYNAEDCFTGVVRDVPFVMHEISVTLTEHEGRSTSDLWNENGFWLEIPTTLPEGLYISSPDLIHADADPSNPAPVATLDVTSFPQADHIQSRLDSHFTAPAKWALHIESGVAHLYVRTYLKDGKVKDGKVVDYFDSQLFEELTEETLQRDIDVLLTLREVAELLVF